MNLLFKVAIDDRVKYKKNIKVVYLLLNLETLQCKQAMTQFDLICPISLSNRSIVAKSPWLITYCNSILQ